MKVKNRVVKIEPDEELVILSQFPNDERFGEYSNKWREDIVIRDFQAIKFFKRTK